MPLLQSMSKTGLSNEEGKGLVLEGSSHVFEDAFHGHWYKCNKATKVNLGIICTATQRPIRLTPLGSQTAELSLKTFIWVVRAMVSFYMALTQVKEKFKSK
ncbi:hypothetical protein J6590_006979 [Homalodisca vitripennis]|nr:hypothetical protein J6590_006979 [Homalodisca vitripennis]